MGLKQIYGSMGGNIPLVDLLVKAGLVGGASKVGSKFIYDRFKGVLPHNIREGMGNDPSNKIGGAAALATALYNTYSRTPEWSSENSTKSNLKAMLSSLLDKDFFDKNPDLVRDTSYSGWFHKNASSFSIGLNERNRFKDSIISKQDSLDTILNDPYITSVQKGTTGLLISDSTPKSLYTSGMDLMKTATKSGVGFGSAYAFGNTLGGIFSLPKGIQSTVSTLGGVAGALYNSKIFN